MYNSSVLFNAFDCFGNNTMCNTVPLPLPSAVLPILMSQQLIAKPQFDSLIYGVSPYLLNDPISLFTAAVYCASAKSVCLNI